ncbi:MAG: hypothetical protein AAGA60_24120 [Cyanobacteria bacterium P01_E01_bin.42]
MSRVNFALFFRSPLLWNSLAIAFCLVTVVGLQRPKLAEILNREQLVNLEGARQEEQLENTRLQLVQRMPDFGFGNLLANWELLQFLQYFGDEPARDLVGYALAPEYFRIILDRDPRFLTAYVYLGTSGTIYAANPEETDAIMERGIQQLTPQIPQYSYYALRNKGINEILFLGDLEAAQQTFAKAADWASIYDDPLSQAIAQQSRNTVSFLASSPSITAVQVSAWGMILAEVQDERTQQIAVENIYRLGGEIQQTPEGGFQVILPSSP